MSKNRARHWWKPALCGVSMLLGAAPLYAQPVAVFSGGGVSITLHDDECRLKSEITNLPRRAVWVENGVSVEGCFGLIEQVRVFSFYFADKTATALPTQIFTRITAT